MKLIETLALAAIGGVVVHTILNSNKVQIPAVFAESGLYGPIHPKNTVIVVFTRESLLEKNWMDGFCRAMKAEWGINVGYVAVEPEPSRVLDQRTDYMKWRDELGLQDWQTLFINDNNLELFDTYRYDGYVYPDVKIGYYESQYAQDSYLLSHEILHMVLYEQSNGDITVWSMGLHARTNAINRAETTRYEMIGEGYGEYKQAYKLVPKYMEIRI